jgi:hypothetical protein
MLVYLVGGIPMMDFVIMATFKTMEIVIMVNVVAAGQRRD